MYNSETRWTGKQIDYLKHHYSTDNYTLSKKLCKTIYAIKSMKSRLKFNGALSRKVKLSGRPFSLNLHTEEETEFLSAIAKFRNTHNRPPTLIEGYQIALNLGYSKK